VIWIPIVTILEKLYGSVSPTDFEERYLSSVKGLNVQVNFAGTTERGWILVHISGKDQTIVLSLLDREFGLAPYSLEELKRYSLLRGRVAFSCKSENELCVDVPIGTESLNIVVSEKSLQGQLADGKKVPFQRLVELFCLVDHVPIEVKIAEAIKNLSNNVKAVLSERQISLFHNWVQYRFDRLIVLGSLFSDVEQTIKSCRLSRDVIRTESLGVLEHVVLCKLGTDAIGLIPKLGRHLKSAVLVPFSPKKILKEIGSQPFDA
jgi:hypothetical protein